jgi:hypothetical protein
MKCNIGCHACVWQAFGDAFNLVDMTDSKEDQRGPYMIRNILGTDITVDLNNYFTVIFVYSFEIADFSL